MENETKKLILRAEVLSDVLLRKAMDGDVSALKGLLSADLASNTFHRGYLLGLRSALACEGVPAFLSGYQLAIINAHLAEIITTFEVVEHLKQEKEAAHA